MTPPPDDLLQIATFIAELQARPSDRMANVGVRAGEIADQIQEFDVSFVTRGAKDDLTGVLGVDYDPEARRSWLYGPFVAEARWDEVADDMWHETRRLVPSDARDVDMGYAATNARAADFATRHGFETFSEGVLMTFPKERLIDLPGSTGIRPIRDQDRDEVARLHAAFFPDAWPNAHQMFERMNHHRRVFVACEDDHVLGYLHAEVKPAHGEGFVEFVGVNETARGRGVARTMVAAALRWMLSFDRMEDIELYVRDDNPAAARVYSSVGFRPGLKLVGARLLL